MNTDAEKRIHPRITPIFANWSGRIPIRANSRNSRILFPPLFIRVCRCSSVVTLPAARLRHEPLDSPAIQFVGGNHPPLPVALSLLLKSPSACFSGEGTHDRGMEA